MVKKYDIIGFKKVSKKITEPITKFGGQPIGLKEYQWPISEGWDDKMMFVGQILIEKGMLGNDKDFMAYIFVTHPKSYEDDFFDPDVTEWNSGENAVIIRLIEDIDFENEDYAKGPVGLQPHSWKNFAKKVPTNRSYRMKNKKTLDNPLPKE